VALINNEEATVKRFFLKKNHIELRPENRAFKTVKYGLGEVMIQGKVVGVQWGRISSANRMGGEKAKHSLSFCL
jgi:repressor LexA